MSNGVASQQLGPTEPLRPLLGIGRVLPALFPPLGTGIQAAQRRVVLALVLSALAIGTATAIVSGQLHLLPPIGAAWIGVLVACAIPWHRLPHGSFVVVALAAIGWIAFFVASTGGGDSSYSGLFYLAAMLGAVVVPPLWVGLVVGAVAALGSLAPLLYQSSSVTANNDLFVRASLIIAISLFGSWLIHELTRIAVVASADRDALNTEQQSAAELRRLQALRQEYMSVVAHELRNPLIGIGAAARVVAKDLEGKPSEAMVNGIIQEIRHALELLDGLTDVASLESGRMRIVLRATELTALIRSTVIGQAPDHDLRLVGLDHPVLVLADEARIAQVIRNLVGNAAKYSPKGTVIEVSVGMAADRRNAVVQVRDEGPGVPPLERAKLFDRFSRLSTAGATRGSGLGLYVSRGIIRDHHGDLSADWPSGGGSVFTFTLPLATGSGR